MHRAVAKDPTGHRQKLSRRARDWSVRLLAALLAVRARKCPAPASSHQLADRGSPQVRAKCRWLVVRIAGDPAPVSEGKFVAVLSEEQARAYMHKLLGAISQQ